MSESTFKGAGGLNIFFRSWHPSQAAKGVVAIVPGFNSHSGYYDWVAMQLTGNGLAVYAIDLRGRGKSDGERFYVQNFEDYVTDAASFVSIVKEKEKGLPVFMLGHSAGVSLHATTLLIISRSLQVLSARASPIRFLRPILPWLF
jgi:alpha-beta hydrolase superfamily lysophospholipase